MDTLTDRVFLLEDSLVLLAGESATARRDAGVGRRWAAAMDILTDREKLNKIRKYGYQFEE